MKILQYLDITSLVNGYYDGFVKFTDIPSKYNFGLGTFDHLDGELIAFEDKKFQLKSDGSVFEVTNDSHSMPFLALCPFKSEGGFKINSRMNYNDLQKFLFNKFKLKNYCFAFKLKGKFKRIDVRTVSRQEKPYKKLLLAIKNQKINSLKNTSGTLVGFWVPNHLLNLNVKEFHFHYINDDFSKGGHVFDLDTNKLFGEFCIADKIEIIYPKFDNKYSKFNISLKEFERDLEKTERNPN